jgi:hypothetical protein
LLGWTSGDGGVSGRDAESEPRKNLPFQKLRMNYLKRYKFMTTKNELSKKINNAEMHAVDRPPYSIRKLFNQSFSLKEQKFYKHFSQREKMDDLESPSLAHVEINHYLAPSVLNSNCIKFCQIQTFCNIKNKKSSGMQKVLL